MARITVEDALKREPNRFALVKLAAKRAKQLLKGGKSLIEDSKNKAVVTSLREIASGKVRFATEEDLERKREEERIEREARLAAQAETTSKTLDVDDLFAEPNGEDSSDEDEATLNESDSTGTPGSELFKEELS